MTIRSLNKLRPIDITTLGDGSHTDGGGLKLWVRDRGRLRSWVLRYTVNGKTTEMGLGAAAAVPLKAARAKRDELRALIDEGLDPLAERRKRRAEQEAKKTFAEVAKLALAKKVGGWNGGASSTSHAAWVRTIDIEAKALHHRPVDEIEVEEVKRIVASKWGHGFHDEARMGLARLATVFDYAKAHGWRTGDNPASWSIFKHIAPDTPKIANHHPSVDWREAPAVMARLRQSAGMSGLALEFAILTGARIGEALKATWDEIDFERAIWTVPPERMKRGIEHTVPLSSRAAAMLTALHERRGRSKLIFPGARPGQQLSRTTLLDLSNRVSDGKASCHGWRSTLRSWMADEGVEFAVAEAALAHSSAAVVAAYQRSQLIERRRPIMEKWSRFLSGEEPATATVIPLRRA
jgi:integrase